MPERDTLITQAANGGEHAVAPNYIRQYVMPAKRKRTYLRYRPDMPQAEERGDKARRTDASQVRDDARARAKAVIVALCLASVVLLAYPIIKLGLNRLKVEKVVINGECVYSAEEIMAAAGVEYGEKLYAGRDYSAAAEKAMASLPYLDECEISRAFPNGIRIKVTAAKAAIYVCFDGEYYAISDELKVLERAGAPSAFATAGAVETQLPRPSRINVGEKIEFFDIEDASYIENVLEAIDSSGLKGRFTKLFFDKKFDLVGVIDGNVRIKLGSPSDVSLKLEKAQRLMEESGIENGELAVVDVINPDVYSVKRNADIDPDKRTG